jgi:hypothetical protein
MKEATGLLLWAWSAALATGLQVYGIIRYLNRDLDDWAGVSIFTLAAVVFATSSVVAFVRWNRVRAR